MISICLMAALQSVEGSNKKKKRRIKMYSEIFNYDEDEISEEEF